MSDQSLETFFDKLVEVLFKDVGFYIPSALIPANLLKEMSAKIPAGFLDQLSILDISDGFGVFELEEFNDRLILKRTLLEKNIFKLLKKKKVLDTDEFYYILDKYLDQVEFYCAIANWLSVNLGVYHKNEINVHTIGSFELQNEFYKAHFIELIDLFYASDPIQLKEYYDLSELLKVFFPDLIARYDKASNALLLKSDIDLSQQEIKEGEKSPKKKTGAKKKVKKEPLVSEQEAEEFLLKNVFHINFD